MTSTRRRGPICGSILASMLLAGTGCASAPPIVAQPDACSSLLPSSHRKPVPGADLPPDDATAGDWVAFADAQTGQLDKANGHTADVIEIVERCEARDRAALKRLQRPWWRVWG
jgi:hypothetical protein